LEEGKKLKQKLQEERELLELIKSRKLESLIGQGVNMKYCSELASHKLM
jgi:hypothetical protein